MVLENNILKLEIHPNLGGKITSFFHKEKRFELAAQTHKAIEELPEFSCGFGPYAFGMDDAFPNIDAEIVDWKGSQISYPDHGEIWTADFRVIAQSADCTVLGWQSPMGYHYMKTLQLVGNALKIHYEIENVSNMELPCFWTWHGLMRYEEDMEVILPESTTHCRNVLTGPELGEAGTVYSVGGSYDFTKVPGVESKTMSKFYAEHPVKTGKCGLRYPSQNAVCILEYDEEILPYWGFWITAGGLQGDYNCALEPTNGFYDSISTARKNGRLPVLACGERMVFELKITLD